jgi:hypothetical protein
MNQLDRTYYRGRAQEERARANAQPGTVAAIFYHKLADAYERKATGSEAARP